MEEKFQSIAAVELRLRPFRREPLHQCPEPAMFQRHRRRAPIISRQRGGKLRNSFALRRKPVEPKSHARIAIAAVLHRRKNHTAVAALSTNHRVAMEHPFNDIRFADRCAIHCNSVYFGDVVDHHGGSEVHNDRTFLSREHSVDRDRQHVVVIDHAACFVRDREPVAVRILPESDIALVLDDQL
jgi:hypothetical protein